MTLVVNLNDVLQYYYSEYDIYHGRACAPTQYSKIQAQVPSVECRVLMAEEFVQLPYSVNPFKRGCEYTHIPHLYIARQ
jgi:hypothetical protein